MGYELHITRREQWFDEDSDITKEELLAYVRSDLELSFPDQSDDGFAIWRSPSGSHTSWLQWLDGRLLSKNPYREFIDKMVRIASALSAKVQGDDGEVYRSSSDIENHEPVVPTRSPDPEKVALWAGRLLLLSFIALLVALYLSSR